MLVSYLSMPSGINKQVREIVDKTLSPCEIFFINDLFVFGNSNKNDNKRCEETTALLIEQIVNSNTYNNTEGEIICCLIFFKLLDTRIYHNFLLNSSSVKKEHTRKFARKMIDHFSNGIIFDYLKDNLVTDKVYFFKNKNVRYKLIIRVKIIIFLLSLLKKQKNNINTQKQRRRWFTYTGQVV